MAALAAYAQAPWGGTVLPAPPLGQLPPPIPGNPTTFSYANQLGAYPYAFPTWAGGRPLATYPGGGILAHADDTAGVVTLTVWWPDATVLQVVRIGPDGTRTPVRGGYSLSVTATTRHNWCTNPSIEVGNNGFVPDAGSPTLAQLADATAPNGGYVLRCTNAGSGSNGVTVPLAMTTAPGVKPVTVGWSMRCSARPTSVTLTIAWTDAGGGALATNTATLTADQINTSVTAWGRQVLTVAPPSGAVTPTLKIVNAGMPAGGTVDLDAIIVEFGATDGSYVDGDSVGGSWVGTADLSASVIAPLITLQDGECPLDTIVSYVVSYPGITGGRVQSSPVVLDNIGYAWLTHPLSPNAPVLINLREPPVLKRVLQSGVFYPLGGQYPIVVTDGQRRAASGSATFVWLSFAERDALVGMLADGSPLLLRTPGDFGYDADLWLSFQDVTEDRDGRKPWQDAGLLKGEFVTVARPDDI